MTTAINTAQESLARGVEGCTALVARYLGGFGDANRTEQAEYLPNHLAWCLGHCALTMQRVAELIDGRPISDSDFVDGERGDETRFGKESVAFSSVPRDDQSMYPSLSRCQAIFDGACQRLADAVRNATDEQLAREVKWGGAGNVTSLHDLVLRMIFHNGTHCGQIVDLRRAMGMGSIFSK